MTSTGFFVFVETGGTAVPEAHDREENLKSTLAVKLVCDHRRELATVRHTVSESVVVGTHGITFFDTRKLHTGIQVRFHPYTHFVVEPVLVLRCQRDRDHVGALVLPRTFHDTDILRIGGAVQAHIIIGGIRILERPAETHS